jgi:hypothetical protein|eukprot:COSAG02_NODE_1187_length_14003_cov_48.566240_8_plen_122_part_00
MSLYAHYHRRYGQNPYALYHATATTTTTAILSKQRIDVDPGSGRMREHQIASEGMTLHDSRSTAVYRRKYLYLCKKSGSSSTNTARRYYHRALPTAGHGSATTASFCGGKGVMHLSSRGQD